MVAKEEVPTPVSEWALLDPSLVLGLGGSAMGTHSAWAVVAGMAPSSGGAVILPTPFEPAGIVECVGRAPALLA